jgi:hypothetical protein
MTGLAPETCPSCKGRVDAYATKCPKCNYAFGGPQTDQLAILSSIDQSVKTIKAILLWWLILSVISAVLWLIVKYS